MKIKFLGAAGTVTGSSYALTSGSGSTILVDLGMFQGTPEIDKFNFQPFEFDAREIDDVVLTHAHLDHCGRLPIILPKGFVGKIFMTPSTADLTELTLLDSAKVALQDNRPILYDKQLAFKTINRFHTIEYRTPVRVGNFKVTFRDAGHILGSASLEIEDLQPDSEFKKIIFSGDLGNFPEDLVMQTELLDDADAVVMESTYGDSLHPESDPALTLEKEIQTVEKTGGTLLIPAFALERTQEVLHMIMHLKKTGKIKMETPIFLDSPMAEKATLIYMDNRKLFNDHIQKDIDEEGSPFGFPGLKVLDKKSDRLFLNHEHGTKVIIAGSGMMNGGRIVGHAAHYLGHPLTRLLIVGYQGEGTLGRELVEGKTVVDIDGMTIHVKATVTNSREMSSHADQGQLLTWLKHIQGVKKVILTHGEDGPRSILSQKISTELGISDVAMPHLNEEIKL